MSLFFAQNKVLNISGVFNADIGWRA